MHHPELRRPHLAHPIIFLTSGQTGGDPEQGSEDRDRMPPKGRGVSHQSRDWGPPLEGESETLFPAVLY